MHRRTFLATVYFKQGVTDTGWLHIYEHKQGCRPSTRPFFLRAPQTWLQLRYSFSFPFSLTTSHQPTSLPFRLLKRFVNKPSNPP